MADEYAALAATIRRIARGEAEAASPPVERWRVVGHGPLTLESDEEVQVTADDDDVEIDAALMDDLPAVDSVVRVHRDANGDMIVGGVLS